MLKKTKILSSILFFILFCSCTTIKAHSSISNPPTQSFVKIYHRIDIYSCIDEADKNCPVGTRLSSGSGMAIRVIRGIPTVITAGHVCDIGPTEKIKSFTQTVEVLDYQAKVHQAYPILINHNNGKGSPDACMLFVPTLKVKLVTVSLREPKIGQDLYYIGAPLGIYHPPNPLIFRGVFSGDINPSTAQITAPAIGGASGSAVFNMKNEAVGIIWGANLTFQNSSVMTSFSSFQTFVENSRKKLISFSKK
jgi:hypothetical protein